VYPEGYVPAGQQPLVPPPEQTPQPPNPKDTIAAKGKSDAKGSKDAKGKDGGGGKKVEAGKMTDAKGKDAAAGAKNADSAGKKGSEAKEKDAGGAKDGATKKEDAKPEPKLETKKGGKKKGDKKGEEEPVETEERGVQADVPEEVRNLLPYFKVLASTPHQPCFPPILHIMHMWGVWIQMCFCIENGIYIEKYGVSSILNLKSSNQNMDPNELPFHYYNYNYYFVKGYL
jgi:hypothetical protein